MWASATPDEFLRASFADKPNARTLFDSMLSQDLQKVSFLSNLALNLPLAICITLLLRLHLTYFLQQFQHSVSQGAGEDHKRPPGDATGEDFADIDMKSLKQYLLLGKAVANYRPGEDFDGQTVLFQAKDESKWSALIPNEDYNVSEVRVTFNFPGNLCA